MCTPFGRNNPANTETDANSITCITRGNLNIQALTQIPHSSSFTRIWMKIHGHGHPACQCVSISDSSFAFITNRKKHKAENKHNTVIQINYCLIIHVQMVTSAQLADNSQASQVCTTSSPKQRLPLQRLHQPPFLSESPCPSHPPDLQPAANNGLHDQPPDPAGYCSHTQPSPTPTHGQPLQACAVVLFNGWICLHGDISTLNR